MGKWSVCSDSEKLPRYLSGNTRVAGELKVRRNSREFLSVSYVWNLRERMPRRQTIRPYRPWW